MLTFFILLQFIGLLFGILGWINAGEKEQDPYNSYDSDYMF